MGVVIMNKSELIEQISSKTDLKKSDIETTLKTLVTVIADNISNEGGIRISGLGTLQVVKRKARLGRNPQTGETIEIESKYAPVFKASKELKEAANRLAN